MDIVGIDLGTTHCAVAHVEPDRGGSSAPVLDFPVPQLVRPGELAARPLLPSCVYLPAEAEFEAEALRLPWPGESTPVVGELARWQGAQVPGRLVASAKSWLCHAGVDRGAPILPWGALPDVPRISPVEATTKLLAHVVRAWDAEHPGKPLAGQEVVITVPASFDEAARALTVTAARAAGLSRFTLLEEPQAAFYDYTARHRARLEQTLGGVRLVLVVDVGGGTTDFTLVHAGVSPEGPDAGAARGRRPPDAGWRQHGRAPRASAGGALDPGREAALRRAVDAGHPGRAPRQGGPPGRQSPSRAPRRGPGRWR